MSEYFSSLLRMSKKRKIKVIDVEQGSENWKLQRRGVSSKKETSFVAIVGSSSFGAAAGLGEYKEETPLAAYHEMIGEKQFDGNEATAHGNAFESVCADYCAQQIEERLYETGIFAPSLDNPNFQGHSSNVRVSPDRWGCSGGCATQDGEVMQDHLYHEGFFLVECKCPFGASSFDFNYVQRVKQSHLCQLSIQMAASETSWIYYAVALVNQRGVLEKAIIRKVHFSQEYWDFVFPRALSVIEMATDTLCSGNRHDDYIKNELPEIEDPEKIPLVKWQVIHQKK